MLMLRLIRLSHSHSGEAFILNNHAYIGEENQMPGLKVFLSTKNAETMWDFRKYQIAFYVSHSCRKLIHHQISHGISGTITLGFLKLSFLPFFFFLN